LNQIGKNEDGLNCGHGLIQIQLATEKREKKRTKAITLDICKWKWGLCSCSIQTKNSFSAIRIKLMLNSIIVLI